MVIVQPAQPITTSSQLFMDVEESASVLRSLTLESERSLLGEVINLAGNYKRGMKIGKIEGLLPEHLTEVESNLDRDHGCAVTSFLHIGRACFQRVSREEAQLARQEREHDRQALQELTIRSTPERPLLENAIILPGLSSDKFAFRVAAEAGIPLGKIEVTDFANTEMKVSVLDSVRGKHVIIVHPFGYDSARHLLTLKLLMNAVSLGGAEEITLVLPSFPFARQDRKPSHKRAPISAEVVAADLVNEGMDRLITLEIHAPQIVGFFRKKPVDNLLAIPLATREAIQDHREEKLVIAFPDQGMAKRAHDDGHDEIIREQIGRSVPMIDMRKNRPEDNRVDNIEILGDKSIIKGATVLLPDDLIDTAGTTIECGRMLKLNGAAKVIGVSAHGVFSIDAVEKLKSARVSDEASSPRVIDSVYVTDSVPLYKSRRSSETGEEIIHVVSSAPLLGEAVRRVAERHGDSLSDLRDVPMFYR